jgi:hypothetical protein
LPPVMVIPLGRPLPNGSCDQLGIESTRATPARRPLRAPSRSRTGLAPGGVCLAPLVTEGAVRSYRTVSPLPAPCGVGGLFSVALSFESPRLAVSQHPALRSPDFPREGKCPPATTCPARARSGATISGARLSRVGWQRAGPSSDLPSRRSDDRRDRSRWSARAGERCRAEGGCSCCTPGRSRCGR